VQTHAVLQPVQVVSFAEYSHLLLLSDSSVVADVAAAAERPV